MFEYYKNKREKPFKSLLILIVILFLFVLFLIFIQFKNKKEIDNLKNTLNISIKILEEKEEQIKVYQGMMIEADVKYHSYYSKLREQLREKYNLTKYQKRYDYFINPVEDETEAFTVGYNSEYGSGRTVWPRIHHGTDLQVIGKIINPADGMVYKVGENSAAGRYIVMYYNIQGREHLICFDHCNQRLVKKGDKVKQGEELAKYGSTGNSSGPHNHFELNTKIDGVWYSENFYMNSFHRHWSEERFKTWRFVYEL